ncbi:uncharacterized protein LOC114299463 [Camellia sinensis]|uniref:uncharacterized protein LOC114299463 n=1 Tax=Camellia sinensis TaxID=4442 RepID=UPI001035EF1C|nr:uncharacterized protein LOC114299463 [Camellia sinensis]
MKKLEDQAEAATKAQSLAEEKAESAEAIKKVAEAEKKEAEDKKAQVEKELQDALSTTNAEIKAADEKAYAQGMADVTEEYKLQEEDEALVRKPKDTDGAKSPPQNEQVLDLTQDKEGDEVIPKAVPDTVLADIPSEVKTIEQTLQEIDAKIAAEKEAEVVSNFQIQQYGGEDP